MADGLESQYDPDSDAVARELQQVTVMLIQTLRSEAELARLEGNDDGDVS